MEQTGLPGMSEDQAMNNLEMSPEKQDVRKLLEQASTEPDTETLHELVEKIFAACAQEESVNGGN